MSHVSYALLKFVDGP